MSVSPATVAWVVVVAVAAGGGYWAGRHNAPSEATERVVVLEQTVARTFARTATETRSHQVERRDVVTVTTAAVDGAVVTTTTDKTVTTDSAVSSTIVASDTASARSSAVDTEKQTVRTRPSLRIGAAALESFSRARGFETSIEGAASYRISGPLWVNGKIGKTIGGDTSYSVGLRAEIEF